MGFSLPVTTGLVRTGEERAQLVRRTYSLVFVSILVTMVGAAYALGNAALFQQVIEHKFLSVLCVFIPLMIAPRVRAPLNIAMLMLFTFAEGVLIAPLLAFYANWQGHPGLVTQAAGITVSAFGVLTLYAFLSRRDFSAIGGFFTVGLYVLIATMVLTIFFPSPGADLWVAGIGVIVMSGLLVFDTWRLRNVFGPDEYVIAAIRIYLDLLNMFLFVLRLLGGGRRN